MKKLFVLALLVGTFFYGRNFDVVNYNAGLAWNASYDFTVEKILPVVSTPFVLKYELEDNYETVSQCSACSTIGPPNGSAICTSCASKNTKKVVNVKYIRAERPIIGSANERDRIGFMTNDGHWYLFLSIDEDDMDKDAIQRLTNKELERCGKERKCF